MVRVAESSKHCAGDSYEAGPTACVAHPDVVKDIKKQVKAGRVLSTADARLATLAGLLEVPTVSKTGFNDGVIYPPTDLGGGGSGPVLAALAPSKAVSMQSLSSKTKLNCLVLLVDFSDNKGTQTPAHFQKLLFDPANAKSMHSFYKDLSYGKLEVSGTVTNWIRAKQPYSYYTAGESGTGGNYPQNTPGLLEEVLKTYCASNSLAGFDTNGDGFVDGLFLVHAGGGAEADPVKANRPHKIWSHKWTLRSTFNNSGVKAYAYFTAPEDGKLGVFSHEFGHFLGLPDLYDTSYRSHGIGDWCLMAGGSWNGSGLTPSRLSAWCLSRLGWIKPTNVTATSTLVLQSLETNKADCYRVWTGGKASKEYFLIENRQATGRDAAIPGSGLAVWHIDETQSDNTNPYAYKVALVQADGRRDLETMRNEGDRADLFPGSMKVTKVDDSGGAHPHLRKNDGTATGVGLSAISLKNGQITVTVKV